MSKPITSISLLVYLTLCVAVRRIPQTTLDSIKCSNQCARKGNDYKAAFSTCPARRRGKQRLLEKGLSMSCKIEMKKAAMYGYSVRLTSKRGSSVTIGPCRYGSRFHYSDESAHWRRPARIAG